MSDRQLVKLTTTGERLSIDGALMALSRSGKLLREVITQAAMKRPGVYTIQRVPDIVLSVDKHFGWTPNELAMRVVMEIRSDFPNVDFKTMPA